MRVIAQAIPKQLREETARSLSVDDVAILLTLNATRTTGFTLRGRGTVILDRINGPPYAFISYGSGVNNVMRTINGFGYSGDSVDALKTITSLKDRGLVYEKWEGLFDVHGVAQGIEEGKLVLGAWVHLLRLDHVSEEAREFAELHRKTE